MIENKEIAALLHLIDDPDEEVYQNISNKLISFGKDILPNLENLWEHTFEQPVQEKIEHLIHRVNFKDIHTGLKYWASGPNPLLQGALLVSKYFYPQINSTKIQQNIDKIKHDIWLELNNYLTPLEEINVISSILYNYHKQNGVELAYSNADHYLLNKIIENKKGNAVGNGILYLILCQLLDIPIKAINLPRQFMLAYFDEQYEILNPTGTVAHKIKFYIDPLNGQMYSHKDVENYLSRIGQKPSNAHYKPLDNKKIIQFLLTELCKCFDTTALRYKKDELILLSNLLN